jgi:hypothetical protein
MRFEAVLAVAPYCHERLQAQATAIDGGGRTSHACGSRKSSMSWKRSRTMKATLIAAVLVVLLAGCADPNMTPEERLARQAYWLNMSQGLQSGFSVMSTGNRYQYSQPAPAPFHSYTINGRTYYCSTLGNQTTCN